MEESNLINNDNTYNTDMSTSQSTIGGNTTTNNKFNKDDLQEVTGGGGGGIVTPPTTKVDSTETSQTTGTLIPILLILGDGTSTDEEPVLLEEDENTTYKAVINQTYESDIPIITFESEASSKCDANYVIAVTETDKNTPINYDLTNLSVSFTNNVDNWCSVEFKSPLQVTFPNKNLTADNFPDNSKIIVPVISCKENTGAERNTVITFNIGNFSILHNIKLSVTQNAYSGEITAGPCVLKYVSGEGEDNKTYKYKILTNNTYYIFKNNGSSYIYENENDRDANNVGKFFLCFGIVDQNGNIYDNLPKDFNELKNNYTNLITLSKTNYKLQLIYQTEVYRVGTAAIMEIDIPNDAELQDVITFSYNNKQFMTLKYGHQDQENTIIARAKWYDSTISITNGSLYFLTSKNVKKEIWYSGTPLQSYMTQDNIIFLIDNKYQINTNSKILSNVLTEYNLENNSGYDFNSYMNCNVIDISDIINDVDGNHVYLKDIENGEPFINFKIYIYTRNNQNEYIYLGYIAMGETYNESEAFIGFFDKK